MALNKACPPLLCSGQHADIGPVALFCVVCVEFPESPRACHRGPLDLRPCDSLGKEIEAMAHRHGFLAHEKTAPHWNHHKALGMGLV